ncbi:MAG: hypothetical protein ACREMX_18560 [Gemmatimonadales bacterium]
MKPTRLILILGGIVLAGCGGKGGEEARSREAQDRTAGMGMDSMGMGGHMDMESMNMMPMMRAHMDSMMQRPPEQMRAMMAGHDRMMSEMMDRMGADMRNMKMTGNAEWDALVDSVKRDLGDLPGLDGRELSARMKAHADRVQRLLVMHEGMMQRR